MTKLLVTLNMPTIGFSFEAYLPINKKIGTIKKYLLATIRELTNDSLNIALDKVKMIDQETGKEYKNNIYLIDSGIKNGSQIIILN